jgi:hypothetical protein
MKEQLVMNSTSEIPVIHRHNDPLVFFCERLAGAVEELTHRLQARYERIHPDQSALIRHVIAEAEAKAWELSFFPHLFLPDLVEARIAELTLQPAFARSGTAFAHAA